MDRITEQLEKPTLSSYLNCSFSPAPKSSSCFCRSLTHLHTMHSTVTRSGLLVNRPLGSNLEAHRLGLSYKTILCVLPFPSDKRQGEVAEAGNSNKRLLWSDPADAPVEGASKTDCAEQLFLQQSPRTVVLAQLTVSKMQHMNEDKWSRQGNNLVSECSTQAKSPQTATTSCNNIVGLRFVLNGKGQSCHLPVLRPACLPCLMPALTWVRPSNLSSQNKASQKNKKKNHFQSLTLCPTSSCFNTIEGMETNI